MLVKILYTRLQSQFLLTGEGNWGPGGWWAACPQGIFALVHASGYLYLHFKFFTPHFWLQSNRVHIFLSGTNFLKFCPKENWLFLIRDCKLEVRYKLQNSDTEFYKNVDIDFKKGKIHIKIWFASFSWKIGRSDPTGLHSHMAGVAPAVPGRWVLLLITAPTTSSYLRTWSPRVRRCLSFLPYIDFFK